MSEKNINKDTRAAGTSNDHRLYASECARLIYTSDEDVFERLAQLKILKQYVEACISEVEKEQRRNMGGL